MGKSRKELIVEFDQLCHYVESLRVVDDEKWTVPIADGKWSVRDIVAHIMLWDEYFLNEAIVKIANDKPLTLKNINFEEFNQNAVEYAKTKSKDEIINLTVKYRHEIIEQINSLSDEQYLNEYRDAEGNPFTVEHYLLDFIWHDNHHIQQIIDFIE